LRRLRLELWLLVFVAGLLLTAGCRPLAPEPPATPLPTPTPVLIPPIQPGDGTDLIDRLLETGVIRVGIRVWPEAEFSPPAFRGFSNAAIGGALNGYEVGLAYLIARGLGLELEMVEAYPPVIAGGDWRGEWDIAIASLVPLDQPTGTVAYSEPYAYFPTGILVPTGSNIQSPEQLAGRRVGVFEHTVYQQMLTASEPVPVVQDTPLIASRPKNSQLVVLSNVQKAIRQLGQTEPADNGLQVDAILGPAPVFQQAISQSELPLNLLRDDASLPPHSLVVAAAPQDGLKVDRLLDEINKLLARLHRQGTLSEMSLEWYGEDFSRPQ
jgi:polar amino acid transport system substrate-binding protein